MKRYKLQVSRWRYKLHDISAWNTDPENWFHLLCVALDEFLHQIHFYLLWGPNNLNCQEKKRWPWPLSLKWGKGVASFGSDGFFVISNISWSSFSIYIRHGVKTHVKPSRGCANTSQDWYECTSTLVISGLYQVRWAVVDLVDRPRISEQSANHPCRSSSTH